MEEAPLPCVFGLTELHLAVLQGRRGSCTLTLADRGLRLSPEDFQTIAAHLAANTSVLKLVIPAQAMTEQDVRAIADALRQNTTLLSLHLEANQITEEGAKLLVDALKSNTTLQSLSLANNQIGPEGARCFAELLRENTTLKELNLRSNLLRDAGVRYIAEALQENSTLTSLVLDGNVFEAAETGASWRECLAKNTTLQRLSLLSTGFGPAVGLHLAKGLEENSALQHLHIADSAKNLNIGEEGINAIVSALKKNEQLALVDLRGFHLSKYSTQLGVPEQYRWSNNRDILSQLRGGSPR